jgi:RHS repeat-associated protein
MMTKATVGTDVRNFVYTADDERIAVKQGATWTWSVRDQSGKVLREFTSMETGNPFALSGHAWTKDYVWRDGLLLASTSIPAGYSSPVTYHYHLNHLGTPRMITRDGGVVVSNHTYYPFGSEMDLAPQENPVEAMKFTGHERDVVAGSNHSVDYMHARYYNANLGRFLEVDPKTDINKNLPNPLRWNRYSYVQNNPLNATDPNGKDTYEINRTIGAHTARSPYNPITHTFIATTSGGAIRTYSWGNTPDQFTQNGWNENKPEDQVAAKEALDKHLAVKVGDSTLDPYVKAAFDALKVDPMSAHWNLGVFLNCKFEAGVLLKVAIEAKNSDEEEKKKNAPPVKKAPPDQPHKDDHE